MPGITVNVSDDILKKCKEAKMNMSKVCREALIKKLGTNLSDTLTIEIYEESKESFEKAKLNYEAILQKRRAERESKEKYDREISEAQEELRTKHTADNASAEALQSKYREALAKGDKEEANRIKEELKKVSHYEYRKPN